MSKHSRSVRRASLRHDFDAWICTEVCILPSSSGLPFSDAHRRKLDYSSVGCGGLAEGFSRSGLTDSKEHWAVDSWDAAVQSYKLNFPGATVIPSTCGAFLQRAVNLHCKEHEVNLHSDPQTMQEAANIQSASVPEIGQVEVVASGPPCQVSSICEKEHIRDVPSVPHTHKECRVSAR